MAAASKEESRAKRSETRGQTMLCGDGSVEKHGPIAVMLKEQMTAKLENVTSLLNTVIARWDNMDHRVTKLESEQGILNTRFTNLEGSAWRGQFNTVGVEFWGVPKEGVDSPNSRTFIKDFIADQNLMKVENSDHIEIEKAHISLRE